MNLDRLNINIRGNPAIGFSGGEEVIDELSSVVGAKIPLPYKAFLRLADGGHPEIGSFCTQGSACNNTFDIDWFYSVANSDIELIGDALKKWGAILGNKNLPIARDGGDNQIYLDLSSGGSSVWLYLHDEGGKRLKISDDFERFLDSLVMNPDFI